jgi:hypothetical protein
MSLTLGAFGPPDPSTDNLAWPVPWRGRRELDRLRRFA